jgi:hypothetical protein
MGNPAMTESVQAAGQPLSLNLGISGLCLFLLFQHPSNIYHYPRTILLSSNSRKPFEIVYHVLGFNARGICADISMEG